MSGQPAVPIEVLFPRMMQLAEDINGPGMAGQITGGELRGLINHITDLRRQLAEALVAATPDEKPTRKRAARDENLNKALGEVVQALADVLESHSELWGFQIVDALEAWAAQQGIEVPAAWREGIAAALGGAAK